MEMRLEKASINLKRKLSSRYIFACVYGVYQLQTRDFVLVTK